MSSLVSKIYTLAGPRELFLKEEEIDSNLSPDEIICETVYSAISPGTETAAYIGLPPLRPGTMYPRVVGYCNVAKVVRCGDAVSNWDAGDYLLSFQSHRSSFRMRATDFALKLHPDVSLRAVAATYLFHLGYHAIISADARAGHYVAIVGLGTLGVTSAIMAANIGAVPVAFSNQDAPALLIDRKIPVLKKEPASFHELAGLTHGTGMDVVINTSNSWNDWKLSLELVRKGGTVVNVGFPGRGEALPDFNPLDPTFTYFKNIQIKSLCYINEAETDVLDFRFNMKRNLQYLLDKIYKGSIPAKEILTDEIHYTQLGSQYEKYASRKDQLFSTLINWGEKRS